LGRDRAALAGNNPLSLQTSALRPLALTPHKADKGEQILNTQF